MSFPCKKINSCTIYLKLLCDKNSGEGAYIATRHSLDMKSLLG